MLTLAVKDDGEGIPALYHQQIFECYFQVDPHEGCPVRGHGLGLAGVMILVEDMGGQLLLESDAGKGALSWCGSRFVRPPDPPFSWSAAAAERSEDVVKLFSADPVGPIKLLPELPVFFPPLKAEFLVKEGFQGGKPPPLFPGPLPAGPAASRPERCRCR